VREDYLEETMINDSNRGKTDSKQAAKYQLGPVGVTFRYSDGARTRSAILASIIALYMIITLIIGRENMPGFKTIAPIVTYPMGIVFVNLLSVFRSRMQLTESKVILYHTFGSRDIIDWNEIESIKVTRAPSIYFLESVTGTKIKFILTGRRRTGCRCELNEIDYALAIMRSKARNAHIEDEYST
jgi:hypothetical protein